MEKDSSQRIFGLDILRTLAIILVLLGHSSGIICPAFPAFPWIPIPDGVDLFFVLSGFLVGGILMDGIRSDGQWSFTDLRQFIRRRWFRTLPNYFLFLFINIILVNQGVIFGELNRHLITFFFFLQNFHITYFDLFTESWSLSVEEWFYLSFPILCFLSLKLRKVKFSSVSLPLIISGYLLFPLLYRILTAGSITTDEHYELFFRKLVLTRLDSIGFGILAAWFKRWRPVFWQRFRLVAFFTGIVLLFFLCRMHTMPATFYLKTLHLTLLPLSIAILLPALDSVKTEKLPGKPFAFISRISYSMYFCNSLIFQIYYHYFHPETTIIRLVSFAGCWFAIILISWLNFSFFERPLTGLRDK